MAFKPRRSLGQPHDRYAKDATDKGKNALLVEREEDLIVLESLVMEKPPFIPKAFLKVMARERMVHAPLEKKIFNQILAHTLTEDVTGLAIPSLIVWGNQDNILHPDNAQRLHALLPHSELIRMEGTGHLPMVERPEKSAKDYLHFRKKLLEKTSMENGTPKKLSVPENENSFSQSPR